MKVKFFFLFVLVFNAAAFSKTSELFPLTEMPINMTYDDFREAYPEAKPSIIKSEKDSPPKDPTLNFFFLTIADNRFWNQAMITTQFDAAQSLILSGKDHSKLSKKTAHEIYKQLLDFFGEEADRKIAFVGPSHNKQKKMPVYVWEKNGLVYAFEHTRFSNYQEGDEFSYKLRVFNKGSYKNHFQGLYDYDENDKEMFEHLSGKKINKAKLPSLDIIAAILVPLFILGCLAHKRANKE